MLIERRWMLGRHLTMSGYLQWVVLGRFGKDVPSRDVTLIGGDAAT
jgi:hypothetical protein